MIYKTNYELYTRPSIDSRRSPPPPDELLSPLATLYPHVTALQPQYNPDSCTFTGYRHTGYWAAAYTTESLEEPFELTRRGSDNHLHCRFVSKLRRLLSREEIRTRRSKTATSPA